MHHRGSLVFVFLCVVFQFAFASSVEMEKANNFLAKEAFKDAEKAYLALLDSGYYSADLYYNLAIAYYKQGNLPNAILNSERALKYRPNSKVAKQNLDIYKSEIENPVYEIKDFFLLSAWKSFVNAIPIWLWTVFSFLFLAFLVLGLRWWLLRVDFQVK